MVDRVEEVEEHPAEDGGTVRRTTVRPTGTTHGMNVLTRLIWTAYGIVFIILAIRFLFVLFGANSANGFVSFIYTISHPLARPFFGIFNYTWVNGVARFEIGTLIAIVIYFIAAWIVARLVNLGRR